MAESLYEGIPGLSEEERAIEKRRRLAEAMLAQGQQPVAPFVQAGRMVAPMSWTQGLAQLAQAYLGGKGVRKAEKASEGLANKRQQMVADAMTQYKQESELAPVTMTQQRMGPPGSTPTVQPIKLEGLTEAPEDALFNLLGNPAVPDATRQAAQLKYASGLRREDRAEAVEARLEERKLQIEGMLLNTAVQGQQRADLERQHAETQKALAAIAASGRQGPAPSYRDIIDPKDPTRLITVDGRLYTPGGSLGDPGVIGIAGKEPAAAKAAEARGTGAESVTELVTTMRDQYNQLQKGGGIVDVDAGAISNVGNYLQSSAPGQTIGQIFGTDNQSIRNKIKSNRTALVNAIRRATGMSARAMDSNVELKMQLDAASDPTKDVQAAQAALNMIESLYGGGSGTGSPQPAAQPSGIPDASAIDAELERRRKEREGK